jgi:hypothetical protein
MNGESRYVPTLVGTYRPCQEDPSFEYLPEEALLGAVDD